MMLALSSNVRQKSKRQVAARGVTLIEVLVAMVVLSLGLLGIAGLQAGVSKYKVNAVARSAIASLYSDFADRVRVNSDVAGTSLLTGVASTSQYLLNSTWATQQSDVLATPSPNCESEKCSTTQRATYDMVVWRQLVRRTLPQGAALVTGNLSTGIALTIMWYDKGIWQDKTITDQDSDAAKKSALNTPTKCEDVEATDGRLARQSCCPEAASAPAGVRCLGFLFTP